MSWLYPNTKEQAIELMASVRAGEICVTEPSFWRGTLLMAACEFGLLADAQYLVEKGVNINERRALGGSALHLAAESKHAAIVEWLLRQGADVNMRDPTGETPLMRATRTDNATRDAKAMTVIFRLLMDYGADPWAENSAQKTALTLAIRSGAAAAVRLLLAQGRRPQTSGSRPVESGALLLASQLGHVEIMEDLLDAGAGIDDPDTHGLTALAWAIASGHASAADFLLGYAANVNKGGSLGSYPVFLAAVRQEVDLLRHLIIVGGNAHLRSAENHTVLSCGLEFGKGGNSLDDQVVILLAAGVWFGGVET